MASATTDDNGLTGWEGLNRKYGLNLSQENMDRLVSDEPDILALQDMTDTDITAMAAQLKFKDAEERKAFTKGMNRIRGAGDDADAAVAKVRDLGMVLIGRMGVGKTTFLNQVAETDHKTAVEGGGTVVAAIESNSWIARDGSLEIDFTIMDTPGLDDGYLQDEKALKSLENSLTKLADIQGVLFFINFHAPAVDASLIEAIFKYRDIFGDAFKKNWAIVFTHYPCHPSAQKKLHKDHKTRIQNAAEDRLKKANLGIVPAAYFYLDSKPDRKEYDEYFHPAVDEIFRWAASCPKIQTKNFNGLRDCHKAHLRHLREVKYLWDVKYKSQAILRGSEEYVLELHRTSFAFARTALHLFLYKFNNVVTITLVGLPEGLCKELSGKEKTCKDFFTDLQEKSDYFMVNVVRGQPKDVTLNDSQGSRTESQTSYDIELRYFPRQQR